MSGYGYQPQQSGLNFYPSTYSPAPASQASYGYGPSPGNAPYNAASAYNSGFGATPVSGRMGEQGGLRTGWLAAFGTEGYEGEPPLLEELGVNFGHIRGKVC